MTRPSPTPHDRADGLAGPGSAEDLEALLMYLKQSRGFDFAAYKRSGLMRRIRVRMQTIGIVTFDDYQDYLEVDPDEFTRLFNTILINVTTFFRDGPTWEYLAERVLPMLGGDREGAQPIRIWSAGCASGEEPYTIAMLMAERLGAEQFRERVKIYATDADEDALSQARLAGYTEGNVRDVPPHLLEKYFDRVDDRFIFNKELRRSVIFGRHDLIQDPPISRVHLLICRNCLMYFNAEVQSRILARFHFALAGGGVLFLGKAETLLTNATTFRALDVKRRLFTKAELHPADRPALLDFERVAALDGSDQMRIRNSAADVSPVAQLLVDSNGIVVQMNHQLRNLFGLSPRDLGRRLQDLELSYRPFELRSCIQQAYADGRTMTRGEGVWTTPTGDSVTLDLKVIPVPDGNAGFLGAGVYYEDVTRQRRLEDEVRRTSQELEAALEELQSTNEELETTNEELQSTVEELETTNEELQSTNEELETMNEELQSTNEELQRIYQQARERSEHASDLNAFLEAILASLRGAVVVVDNDLRVLKWNYRAEDMWGLRSAEVLDKNLLNLDFGLPVERLKAPIRACLAGDTDQVDLTVVATNRRGKPVHLKVICSPLATTRDKSVRGAIIIMEDADARE